MVVSVAREYIAIREDSPRGMRLVYVGTSDAPNPASDWPTRDLGPWTLDRSAGRARRIRLSETRLSCHIAAVEDDRMAASPGASPGLR